MVEDLVINCTKTEGASITLSNSIGWRFAMAWPVQLEVNDGGAIETSVVTVDLSVAELMKLRDWADVLIEKYRK